MGLRDVVPESHVKAGFSEAQRSFWPDGGTNHDVGLGATGPRLLAPPWPVESTLARTGPTVFLFLYQHQPHAMVISAH